MYLLFALVACKGSPTPPTDTDVVDTDAPTDTDTDTDLPIDTAPELPVIDCANLPGPPFDVAPVPAGRGYHGLAFDSLGNMVGGDNVSLIKLTAPGESSILSANVGVLQQIERLPDDTFVAAADSGGQILVIEQDGSRRAIANGIGAYGVTVGPDGMVYTANQQRIHKIDPIAETVEVWLDFPSGTNPKVLDFSPDLTKMYVGTITGNGRVYAIELDTDLQPVGVPTVFATGLGSWHDGLRVDACGNLYVAEFTGRRMYKVTPDGTVTVFADFQNSQYGHGVQFGSGVGDWDDHTIYMPQPYNNNTVLKATIGVPHWSWRGGAYITIF